ncbi:MAG: hypothetical protein NXI30_19360 [bacterium]|nr:hypothetical protein [bacterium]
MTAQAVELAGTQIEKHSFPMTLFASAHPSHDSKLESRWKRCWDLEQTAEEIPVLDSLALRGPRSVEISFKAA